MRYKAIVSYDGTNYCGYQMQPNLSTIQLHLESAISYINNQNPTKVHASGRTDKGVHANNQVIHFDIDIEIDLYKLKRAINSNLPNDIYVKSVEIVDNDFHARYSAKKKEYIYYINIGEYDPLNRYYQYQYNKFLDIELMKKASKYLEGVHDFRAFVSSEDKRENSMREIYEIKIEEINNIIQISFIGNGFMKYQVRNMVGLLIEIGAKKRDYSIVLDIIKSKNRASYGKIAPSNGLYLNKIYYY